MRPDIVELDAFYGRLQGQYARRLINLELRKLWPDTTGQRILGLGYPGPFLQLFDEAERRIVMMPATQGAARWPADGANAATLAREDELPFAERVERVPMSGAPMVKLDNSALIEQVLEDWNAMFPFSDESFTGDEEPIEESSSALCSATARRLGGDPGAWLLVGILLYARGPRRRRRRA